MWGCSSQVAASEPQWSSNTLPVATTSNRHGLRPVNLLLVLVPWARGTGASVPPSPSSLGPSKQQSESLGKDRVGPELELWVPATATEASGEPHPFLGLSFPHL